MFFDRHRLRAMLLAFSFFAAGTAARVGAQDVIKDVPFDAEGHTLDIYRANPTGPTIFYVPGGNWYKHDKNLYEKLGVALAPYGINLIVPQYGSEQKYPDNLIDVIEAIRWSKANLAAYGMTQTQFHLVGHSAGAHLAYMSLTDRRYALSEAEFQSLTLISGLYDINFLVRFGNRWRNWNPLQGWHASPIHTKRLVCLPMTVIVAENDYDIVKRQTNHFLGANAHIGQPLRSLVIPADDHVSILVNAESNGVLRTVIDKVTTTTTINIPDGLTVSNQMPTLLDLAAPPATAPAEAPAATTPEVAEVPAPPEPQAPAPVAPVAPETVVQKPAAPKLEVPKPPAPVTPPVAPPAAGGN